MPALEPIAGGVRIRLHIQPRASTSGPAGLFGEALKIRLTSPPVDGAANEELVRLLATLLEVPRSAVELVSGGSGRKKVVHVAGVKIQEAALRLGLQL